MMKTTFGSNHFQPPTPRRGPRSAMHRLPILLLLLFTTACGNTTPSATLPPATQTQPAAAAATPTAPLPSPTEQPASTPTTAPPQADPTATLLPTPLPLPSATPIPTQEEGTIQAMWSLGDRRPMVYVPAGPFMMGAADSDPDADSDEKPQHEVQLDAFWIDQFEVTNQDYALCVQAGGCNPPAELDFNGFSYEFAAVIRDAPVVNVSWLDARDYCAWAGKRLPTEAEWEKAARGEDGRIYPWGDDPDPFQKAWSCDQGCIFDVDNPEVYDDFSRPASVGSFPEGISPYGAYDMAGNVWEWVFDWYGGDTYSQPDQVNPTGPESGEIRVVRGGSWTSPGTYLRSTYRQARAVSTAWIDVGFRCAMEDDPTRLSASRPAVVVAPVNLGELPEVVSMPDNVLKLAWSPDGSLLAARVQNNGIILWDLANDEDPYTLEESDTLRGDMTWSPDGQYLASGTASSEIYVWEAASGALLQRLSGHSKDVTALAWSPDGSWLVSGSQDETMIVWNTQTWEPAHTLSQPAAVTDLAFSPDGSRMAAAYQQPEILLWNPTTWEEVDFIDAGETPLILLWSPDGEFLAGRMEQGSVMVWDTLMMNLYLNQFWAYSSGDLTSIAFSPDGRLLASNSAQGNVEIFETGGDHLVTLEGHTGRILSLAWSPDGRYLASSSGDGTLRFWKMADVLP